MISQTRKTIAIDLDDVVAMTTEAVRVWANEKTGLTLQSQDYFLTSGDYWNYYEAVWERHGITGLNFGGFLDSMDNDQSHIAMVDDARRVIMKLKKEYNVVFITARRPVHKESTRKWLDEYIDTETPLYLSHNPIANQAAQSKGEICAELGVSLLIDDNVDNCQSALQYGVDAIVFGEYGWNVDVSTDAIRCANWLEVKDYLGARK